MDPDAVEDYRHAIKDDKDTFPPVTVFTWNGDDATFLVADGFHRCEAHLAAGKKTVFGSIFICDTEEEARAAALWHAITANKTHGVKRSQKDRRKAIRLAHESQPHLKPATVARFLKVDPKTVRTVFDEMDGVIPEKEEGEDEVQQSEEGSDSGLEEKIVKGAQSCSRSSRLPRVPMLTGTISRLRWCAS